MNLADRQTAEGILFTDMYQLTMAHLYYRMGLHEKHALFDHFFRSYPDYGSHKAGYCINAGLEWMLSWMQESHFQERDIAFLAAQKSQTGAPLFEADFLQWLRQHGNFSGISLCAVPEGRVIHPNVPITVVEGPLAMAQILETSLLNHLNYQILIATKAARLRESGKAQVMLEFGLRRGPEHGSTAATRAALIGGADFSSNVGASAVLGYPPKGTHAHSMVQVFMALGGSELDAFQAYADIYPDDCLLLVDTIDTLGSGVPNAIKVFERLRRKGHKPVGIRLDSGDLAYMSIQAARMLDEAGFPDTSIVLSNSLDELTIWQIVTQIQEEAARYGVDADHLASRLVYGVGTRLVTSEGDASLDGVYKLVAMQEGGAWIPALKISDSPAKTPNPGNKRVWRLYDRRSSAIADLVALADESPADMAQIRLHHPVEPTKYRTLERQDVAEVEPLLVDVLRQGKLVYDLPDIEAMRERRRSDVLRLDPGVRRIIRPHIYHVSLSERLWTMKRDLIASVKNNGRL